MVQKTQQKKHDFFFKMVQLFKVKHGKYIPLHYSWNHKLPKF